MNTLHQTLCECVMTIITSKLINTHRNKPAFHTWDSWAWRTLTSEMVSSASCFSASRLVVTDGWTLALLHTRSTSDRRDVCFNHVPFLLWSNKPDKTNQLHKIWNPEASSRDKMSVLVLALQRSSFVHFALLRRSIYSTIGEGHVRKLLQYY